jgi:nucleoside-diphosphate-sugar epimerase
MPMNERASVLLTGAAGFVGSNIARAAREAGLKIQTHSRYPAIGMDTFADLCNPAAVRNLPWDTVSAVIHCAAAIPSRSDTFARDNTRAAAVLAEALMNAKLLRRVIHVSSVAVYWRRTSENWLISEQAEIIDTSDDGNDAYAQSKRMVEVILDGVSRQRPEVSICHLRASSIYGPGMVRTTLLPTLVSRARQNEPMVLRGPRTYRQNFIHVKDVAALAITMTRETSDWSEPVLNAFSDDTYGLFELAEVIRAKIGSSSAIVDETENTNFPVSTFDNGRVKRHYPRFRTLHDNLQDVPE